MKAIRFVFSLFRLTVILQEGDGRLQRKLDSGILEETIQAVQEENKAFEELHP